MTIFSDVAALAAAIADGAKLAVPPDYAGVSMAATCELVRRGVRGLHLVCVPQSGMQADLLIGAGAVAVIETAAVTLGESGTAPRFAAAVRAGTIRLLDATCPAIHAGLQAAQKGIPFMPLRGLLDTDVLRHRSDWRVMDNPFAPGDRIVALPAIQPDVALFHAPAADREGNVFIGRRRELLTMAHAARAACVTVERVLEGNLLEDAARAGAVIPSIYISHVALARNGAWPIGLAGGQSADADGLRRYADLARTEAGFERFVAQWLAMEPAAA